MDFGTPIVSIGMLGSPVITVRAEKSTLLPIKLPRNLPSLPLSRDRMAFIGFFDLVLATGIPGISLSNNVVM